ncbi:MAG TPA: MFS transporter [Candidatus Acidoferrales bacterium]|jgi:MFS family permease|nr:MFS transporter [Candidatus Acidoferrales bacterium]
MPPLSAATQPVSDARPGPGSLYYGWANVAVAALGMVGTLPGRTQGLGLITEPLLVDLHMNRVSYATINLWATLIGSLFCIPCGRLVDRFGSRAVLTIVIAALAATVLGMSVTSGWMPLAVTITLSRGLGQSALSVVSLTLVGKWFGRGLNQAMGIYSVLVAIGFIAAFPSVGGAVLAFGWRAAWSGVGWALLLAVAPIAWMVVRNGPEDRGLQFDGERPDSAAAADMTVFEALRTTAFWVFALSSSMFGLVYSGISLFNQSILEQRGFDASVYHTVVVISTMLGLAANFAGGWLASRWPIQRVMGLGMAVLSCALVALPLVRSFTHVVCYGAAMGVAGGIITVVFFSVWGQVYGRRHLGKVQGCAQMTTVFASAIGPLLLAGTLERTGSYDSIFYGLAVVVTGLGVASWLVRLPSRRLV